MTQSKPAITGTVHTLPFDNLSPRDFERLCFWLVEREGYECAEHLGAAGSEQGRDIVAWREGELWAFQCKRVQRFGPKDALAEAEKVLALPEDQRPVGLVFIVTCDVSATTRQQVRERCVEEMKCHFWADTELDEKVKHHRDIVEEFFNGMHKSQDTTGIVDDSDRHVAKLPQTLESFVHVLQWQVSDKDLQETRLDIIKVVESLEKLPRRSREFLKVIVQRAEDDSDKMSVLAAEIDSATALNRQVFDNHLAILEEHEFVGVWEDMELDWITLGPVGTDWPIWRYLKEYCDLADDVSLGDLIVDLEFPCLD